DAPGIIPVQVPVAALHRLLHLVLGTAHAGFDMLLQAGAVADDDGGAGIGLRLPQGLQGLGLVITHGHLGHIHIAVGHQDGAQVLLGHLLAAGGELGHGGGGGGLGGLAAGVGVHLGVQHQQVHIPVLGHDVIDAAEADVVGPAVAADGPDGLLGEILTVLQDIGHIFGLLALLQGGDQGVGHGAGLLSVVPVVDVVLDLRRGDVGVLHALQPDQQLLADGILSVEE
ncbi:Transcriptional regulator, partial [Dysosmobacter welbionis]